MNPKVIVWLDQPRSGGRLSGVTVGNSALMQHQVGCYNADQICRTVIAASRVWGIDEKYMISGWSILIARIGKAGRSLRSRGGLVDDGLISYILRPIGMFPPQERDSV